MGSRLLLGAFTGGGGGARALAGRFLLNGLLGSLSPFPLLIPVVMKLLIGCLFLHPSIMSQIAVNTLVGAILGFSVSTGLSVATGNLRKLHL
jgi:hypothetical protein